MASVWRLLRYSNLDTPVQFFLSTVLEFSFHLAASCKWHNFRFFRQCRPPPLPYFSDILFLFGLFVRGDEHLRLDWDMHIQPFFLLFFCRGPLFALQCLRGQSMDVPPISL